MILAIDIGNSRVKVGFFRKEKPFKVIRLENGEDFSAIISALQIHAPKINFIGWLSVGVEENPLLKEMQKIIPIEKWMKVSKEWKLPFTNAYKSNDTLGMDRLAVLAGARSIQPKGAILTINAGTAITYDLLSEKNIYKGGAIAPGIKMRFKALHEFTANLPEIKEVKAQGIIGKTTTESIQSGVINGVISEVEGMIKAFSEKTKKKPIVFLSGGDADFLGNRLKKIIFADSNLVLKGIRSLVKLNCPNV